VGTYRRRQPKHVRSLMVIAFVAIGFGIARVADASAFFFYRFTPIADSQGGFPYQAVFGFPAINGSGRVAFNARLTGGVEGVFTRLGTGGVDALADTTEFNLGFGIAPSINSLNTVLFLGLKQGPNGIIETFLRGSGNSATPLVNSSDNLHNFCGTQINIEGTAAFRAERADGHKVILAQGAGQLNGVVRTIAEEGSEFSALDCAPSIGFDGTVAFVATRNSRRGIFTRAKNGQLTVIADDGGPFAAFGPIALNQQGGIAFQAVRQGFGLGLFRIKNGSFVKVTDYNLGGAGAPAGFSINESGQVAFEFNFGANGSSVSLGPNSLFGRVIGTGSVLFGRTVAFAHIDRDALNSVGQLAVFILFTDGTSMIARGDPVRFPDTVLGTGALQIATLAAGQRVTVSTPIVVPPAHLTLSFDLTFVAPDGELTVKLGNKVLESIAAAEPGVRRRVSIPIDARAIAKEEKLGHTAPLQFVLGGKSGASAQIADVVIPGVLVDRMEAPTLSRWHVDTSAGGSAVVVNAARLPVKIRLSRPGDPKLVKVAVLSSKDFDAPADIERNSLRLAGAPVRKARDAAGKEQLACEARDVNNDKIQDLVCEVEVPRVESSKQGETLQLEAMTQHGWGIAGSNVLRSVSSYRK
jgi:hypothetical protein